MFTQKK